MVGQLQRSVARRKLTRLSSETIIAFLEDVSSVNDKGEILFEKYTIGCKLALACSTESLTGISIPVHLMSKGNVLELFDGIEGHKNVFQSLPEASILSTYISENKQVLSEEDLGGISELFTGHQATWEDGVVKLVHNPKRRGTGKIYTPYDVTAYMSAKCSEALLSNSDSVEELYSKTVLDPAVGSGAFCSQLVRVLWGQASKRWQGLVEVDFRRSVCEQMIHACDIDLEALLLAKVVLWISAGCPENGLRLNLSHGDSLGAGPCKNTPMWFDHTNLPLVEGYDCVVGNPPYVRVKPEFIGKFVFKNTRNLYCAFIELGQNLLNDAGILCLIVPQGIVNSNETQSLRQFLIE
jgi:type I restriction-modification system DNA methylase subunit